MVGRDNTSTCYEQKNKLIWLFVSMWFYLSTVPSCESVWDHVEGSTVRCTSVHQFETTRRYPFILFFGHRMIFCEKRRFLGANVLYCSHEAIRSRRELRTFRGGHARHFALKCHLGARKKTGRFLCFHTASCIPYHLESLKQGWEQKNNSSFRCSSFFFNFLPVAPICRQLHAISNLGQRIVV